MDGSGTRAVRAPAHSSATREDQEAAADAPPAPADEVAGAAGEAGDDLAEDSDAVDGDEPASTLVFVSRESLR